MTEKQRHLLKCRYVIKKNQFYKMRDIYYRAIFDLGNECYDLYQADCIDSGFKLYNTFAFKNALLKVIETEKQYLNVYKDYLIIKQEYEEITANE